MFIPAKRKKPPACDQCKARRVLCHPKTDGSCPRCFEKGVQCTTTPVVRRKRRSKAELERSVEKSCPPSGSPEVSLMTVRHGVAALTPFIGSTLDINTSSEPSPLPPSLQLPAEIVKELIESFYISRSATHPLLSLSKEEALHLCTTNVTLLQPQDRVLLHCILTLSSLSSTSAFIIGAQEISTEQFDILTADLPLKSTVVPDLRDLGFRRESVFLQLWGEALWLANHEGITTNPSVVNASSCWILGHIAQIVLGKGASPFNSAFVCHVRCLAEEGKLGNINALKYHGLMIFDVLGALLSGKSIQYTPNDELLIVRYTSESLEKLLLNSTAKCLTSSEAFLYVHPFAHHIIRLAREASDNLTGVFARSQPLNEVFVIKHFASLDLYHSFLLTVLDQISQLVQQYKNHDRERTYYLRSCLFGFASSWGCLVLPVFEALRDRSLQVVFHSTVLGSSNGFVNSLANDRNHERLQMHFRHARRLASTAAVEMCEALRDVPSIKQIMNHAELKRWATFLMDEDNVMDITHGQRLQALQCFRDALQLNGFYRPDRSGIVESINEYLASPQGLLTTTNLYSSVGFEAGASFTW